MKILRRLVKVLLIVVIVLPILAYFLISRISGIIHNPNIDTSDLSEYSHSHKDGIKNILIMGSDARPGETVSRSDSLRSEEHTSELQSRQYLVCRLLLEK